MDEIKGKADRREEGQDAQIGNVLAQGIQEAEQDNCVAVIDSDNGILHRDWAAPPAQNEDRAHRGHRDDETGPLQQPAQVEVEKHAHEHEDQKHGLGADRLPE